MTETEEVLEFIQLERIRAQTALLEVTNPSSVTAHRISARHKTLLDVEHEIREVMSRRRRENA